MNVQRPQIQITLKLQKWNSRMVHDQRKGHLQQLAQYISPGVLFFQKPPDFEGPRHEGQS